MYDIPIISYNIIIYIYISDTNNEGPCHPDLAEAHGLANDGFLVSQPKEAQRSTRAVMASHGQSSGCDPPLLVDELVRGLHILANILVIEVSLSIDWWYDIQLIINIDYTTQYNSDFNNPIEGSWKNRPVQWNERWIVNTAQMWSEGPGLLLQVDERDWKWLPFGKRLQNYGDHHLLWVNHCKSTTSWWTWLRMG